MSPISTGTFRRVTSVWLVMKGDSLKTKLKLRYLWNSPRNGSTWTGNCSSCGDDSR
ncbi:hypothetical protein [Streptomyces sp. NPDC051684]|uniref:hypothetical protein n=1 Tax=Streptomyces sp. NPDC051684 TaxID=3365670 RepID=UPI0037AB3CC2